MIAFSTANINGHYDFFTGLITLDRFDIADLSLIKLAISETPPLIISEEANNLREIRALIKHEITHFLDHFTTSWGMEMLIRRDLLIDSINQKSNDADRCGEVYFVNISELQMHSEFLKIHQENIPFDECDTVNHNLFYDKKFGPSIIINFYKKNNLVCNVPLSMISLLEANAISNEFLSRFDDLFSMNQDTRNTAERVVECKLKKILNEPTLSEYSVLINLVKNHFQFFNTRELLEFTSNLASFCLNITSISMGSMIEMIRHSFKNTTIGNGIWADLSRGMSRHVLAFKTIIFIYAWIGQAEESVRNNFIELMKNDPFKAIESFWRDHGRLEYITLESERDLILESIALKKPELSEYIRLIDSNNRTWRKNRNLRGSSFNEIYCMDILLNDDSVIKLPNRINIDVIEHTYNVVDAYSKTEKILSDISEKIHMSPENSTKMLEDLLSIKEQARHNSI